MIFLSGCAVSAEQQDSTILTKAACGTLEQIVSKLTGEYGEVPMVTGSGNILLPDSSSLEGVQILFANKHTLTYSFVMMFPENQYGCILGAGNNIHPAPSFEEITPNENQNDLFIPEIPGRSTDLRA